ncbi:glycosyltransferase family 2 protein [Pedobacter sp. HDW13]|uniref:glycosyltransferase family 2 protein n=1 Tax=unclassified Pedobacter TaxID=2628915 RepID=UPI000F5B4467|nr:MULTISPECIES: glycosyltransferase family 2 protein [unclassified Pedobacter]QIL40197.1 glycosyltransferase family 2 protein [Pedobacter sp. HDW13]RQO79286.1 glycosyltransferase [Pedobacter sp. KBW01]
MKKLVSIVIPAYNEADNIFVIAESIKKVFATLSYNYEIILVDDGSSDHTLEKIKEYATTAGNIYFLEFSKNFGHQLAVKAGMDHAFGDCVISMDCDMQHPPELIPDMIAKWEAGYEVVYTIREDDKNLSKGKRSSSSLFYKILNWLSDIDLEPGAADFRLLDQRVVNVFRNFHENEPFLRGLVKWLGFKQFAIKYNPAARFSGKSKYTLKKMLRLALHGVTSFSIKPLYTAVYLGFILSFASVLYIPYIIYAFVNHVEVSGWASVIMTIVFFGGLQLIILGIIGIYVGKMFMQAKNRPNYIIRSTNIKQ